MRRAGTRYTGGLGVAAIGVCLLVGCGVRAQQDPEPLDPRTAGPAPTPTVSVQPDEPGDADCPTGAPSPTVAGPGPSAPAPPVAAPPAPPSGTAEPSDRCDDGS
jgi:hypothetical protein